jgi:hypothetical protein
LEEGKQNDRLGEEASRSVAEAERSKKETLYTMLTDTRLICHTAWAADIYRRWGAYITKEYTSI